MVFVAFEAAMEYFPTEKCVLSGNPVRDDLKDVDVAAARAHFEVEDGQRVLLAMGGSLGAGPINDALRQHLDALLADESLVVVWQTGRRYFDALRQQVADHPRLRLLQYLDRMDYAYAAADLAVCRAGAITCSELAVTGTPSVLVPSPNVTADHQTKNARALADAGAAVLLPEPRLRGEFLPTVQGLMDDADRRDAMTEAARVIARPDAAAEIARAVLALAQQQEGGGA
jgi:UDP-N-acetylglucosamine--N-acetylmuramyl-(pentapeptide) pyrophosphoryl-undecaprenol N-acetylglucosamine transferase